MLAVKYAADKNLYKKYLILSDVKHYPLQINETLLFDCAAHYLLCFFSTYILRIYSFNKYCDMLAIKYAQDKKIMLNISNFVSC